MPCQGFKSQEPALAVAPQQTEEKPQTYPVEIFINGELSFKLDTEDAEGDMRAIKALMTMRTAKRANRPLTNVELYGVDLGIGDVIHTDKHGNSRTLRGAAESDSDHTFKQGDKDPCPPPVAPPLGKILLRPSPAHSRSVVALRQLREGKDVEVDCLEVLDKLLTELGPTGETVVVSTKGPMTLETAHRLRFVRGFEIRPSPEEPTNVFRRSHVSTASKLTQ